MGRAVPSDRAGKVMPAIACQEPAENTYCLQMAIELSVFG